jgi:hypothetical protein
MAVERRGARKDDIRLFGAPPAERFTDTRVGSALRDAARIHLDDRKDRDHLVAVEKLAIDILNDPNAARAFAVNPQEYLRRGGFRGVELDLNSEEVRLAMAMGDPAVRAAARAGDVDAFLDAVMGQGFDITTSGLVLFAAIEVAVYFSAAAVSWVAAAYTVETAVAVHHQVGVIAANRFSAELHKRGLAQLAERVGNREFAAHVTSRAMERVIEEYLELMEEAERADVIAAFNELMGRNEED